MDKKIICPDVCPICGESNSCHNLSGKTDRSCWCSSEFFPKEIFKLVPQEQQGKSCICKACLCEFKLKNKS